MRQCSPPEAGPTRDFEGTKMTGVTRAVIVATLSRRRLRWWLGCLGIAWCQAVLVPQQAAGPGAITGLIVDERGVPVPQALVELVTRTKITARSSAAACSSC